MAHSQLLLFPDPRPLVERLGKDFFRAAPEKPGVYLMRDAADTVLYVGKAVNLRRRLGSYRVANPDRMGPRHLRLLRAVERIEFEECADEEMALAMEARLLRSLRPRFNRAGTWGGLPRCIVWRAAAPMVELAVSEEMEPDWRALGWSYGAWRKRNALARLLWRMVRPRGSFAGLPQGWIRSNLTNRRQINCGTRWEEVSARLEKLAAGQWAEFTQWLQTGSGELPPFETAALEADLETVGQGLANLRAARF